jgi:hypothetical protein
MRQEQLIAVDTDRNTSTGVCIWEVVAAQGHRQGRDCNQAGEFQIRSASSRIHVHILRGVKALGLHLLGSLLQAWGGGGPGGWGVPGHGSNLLPIGSRMLHITLGVHTRSLTPVVPPGYVHMLPAPQGTPTWVWTLLVVSVASQSSGAVKPWRRH